MADNYLEKRMEDYRAGRPQRSLSHTRKTGATLTFPAVRIAVLGVASAESIEAVGQLVRTGCRVAFTIIGGVNGSQTAQSTGGRFYPCDARAMLASLTDEGDAPAVIVVAHADAVIPELEPGVRLFSIAGPVKGAVTIEGGDPAATARTLAALIAAPALPEQSIIL